ncbi:MAG: hypothetical protein ACXVGB_12285, partial [Mycobacteriaceae bacterium]
EGLLVALSHLAATAGRDDVAVQLARLRLQEATSSVQELARAMLELEGLQRGTAAPFTGLFTGPFTGPFSRPPSGSAGTWGTNT